MFNIEFGISAVTLAFVRVRKSKLIKCEQKGMQQQRNEATYLTAQVDERYVLHGVKTRARSFAYIFFSVPVCHICSKSPSNTAALLCLLTHVCGYRFECTSPSAYFVSLSGARIRLCQHRNAKWIIIPYSKYPVTIIAARCHCHHRHRHRIDDTYTIRIFYSLKCEYIIDCFFCLFLWWGQTTKKRWHKPFTISSHVSIETKCSRQRSVKSYFTVYSKFIIIKIFTTKTESIYI